MQLADSYTLLELEQGADVDALKKAFRRKAKQVHPDINLSPHAEEDFIRLHTAYETILWFLTTGKTQQPAFRDERAEAAERKRRAEERARNYARMQYEKFVKECEAYHNSPYAWLFRILYYGLYYLYIFCAMVMGFVPLWAGWEGGIFYLIICLPLYVLAYFTLQMAADWKKEIEPLFE